MKSIMKTNTKMKRTYKNFLLGIIIELMDIA